MSILMQIFWSAILHGCIHYEVWIIKETTSLPTNCLVQYQLVVLSIGDHVDSCFRGLHKRTVWQQISKVMLQSVTVLPHFLGRHHKTWLPMPWCYKVTFSVYAYSTWYKLIPRYLCSLHHVLRWYRVISLE